MHRILEKQERYSDYPGYLSGHPEQASEIKTVSSGQGVTVKIVLKNKAYYGVIDDVYNDETEYLLTCSMNAGDFKPEKIMMLHLQLPSGETPCITCDVKWLLKNSDDNNRLILGMKIIGSPLDYRKFTEYFKCFQH